jgi:UDP-N-acetylmuramate dehydrogenase
VDLKGYSVDQKVVFQRIKDINSKRTDTQPTKNLTGGSTFKNPTGHMAWKLIDQAGCRGIRKGGASISDIHPNFIINDGSAISRDIEDLGMEVQKRVLENSGIKLEWEILRLGIK